MSPDSDPAEKNGAVIALVVAALVAVAAAVILMRQPAPPPPTGGPRAGQVQGPARPESRLPVLATLPEFVLADERGESFDLYDLHGSVWVADFIFTRCQGTCPAITSGVARIARDLASSPALADVRLVSFSVDPDFDTPAVLSDYARAHGADPARWTFLTGTRDSVRGLVKSGFKLAVADVDDPKMPIAHTQNLALVDREGRVRGVYDGLSPDAKRDLLSAIGDLVTSAPPQDIYIPTAVAQPVWLEARATEQIAGAANIRAPHDFKFTDRVGESGITFKQGNSVDVGKYYRAIHYDHGTAVAAADVDGDGLPDLYFVNQVGRNALYKNLGGGKFRDITDEAGVGVGDRACVAASFADIDNDGAPDLFVTSVRDGNLLFHNDGHGHFTDITDKAGVRGHGEHNSGAVFFDYDGDGLLDLFVCNVGRYTIDERRADGRWAGEKNAFAGHQYPDRSERSILYHNLGGGRFEDVTEKSGLMHTAWSGEATAFDYDGDGLPDLYVLAMQGHNELWKNLGGGKFQKTGRTIFPRTPWGAMGVKAFDWNGDGRQDLYVTDMHTDMAPDPNEGDPLRPENEKKKHDPETMFTLRFLGTDGNHVLGNALFTNEGGSKFDEQSDAANVETGWPWGPSVGDLNADGWPDLFVAAGMNYPFRYCGNNVLLNEGGKRFADAEFVVGVEPRRRIVRPWFQLDCDGEDARLPLAKGHHGRVTVWAARASRSAVILDIDGDGDLDIVTNNYGDVPQVLVSDLAQRGPVHFVTVGLLGHRTNRDGVGAIVTLKAGGRAQMQVNDGKSGYLAQSVLPLYFGMGAAESAESIEVRWPTGKTQTVAGPIASGTKLVIEEQP